MLPNIHPGSAGRILLLLDRLTSSVDGEKHGGVDPNYVLSAFALQSLVSRVTSLIRFGSESWLCPDHRGREAFGPICIATGLPPLPACGESVILCLLPYEPRWYWSSWSSKGGAQKGTRRPSWTCNSLNQTESLG